MEQRFERLAHPEQLIKTQFIPQQEPIRSGRLSREEAVKRVQAFEQQAKEARENPVVPIQDGEGRAI